MIAELTNHLWQSTVFALAAGLMTIAFRKNRAQVRYWLWLSASLKFLFPFSLLMALGNCVEWAPATRSIVPTPAAALTIVQISQPFPHASQLGPSPRGAPDWAAIAIIGVWAWGFAAIALRRLREWRRIRAAMRSSTRIGIPMCIEVRSSRVLLEPGVIGLFRPILLLPEGILERLTPPQLDAVLAHELCHARRRDNLTSAIHMLVEAVFWFHPLVWWIGTKLVEERERACDEHVLSLGSKPRDYVKGILSVCKSYLESPLSCVSGVTGSNLKKRIHAILAERVARNLSVRKKLALAAAGLATLAIPVIVGIIGARPEQAQTQSSLIQSAAIPKFELASIKRCNAFRKGSGLMWSPGEVLDSQCTTTQRLIEQAYGLFANGHWNPGSSLTVIGGPAWISSDLYEIEAKAKIPQSRAMMNGPMLQALLESRFKLRVHRETREAPVYALTLAEGGPKLQTFEGSCVPRDFDRPPSPMDCAVARGRENGFEMSGASIADFCAPFLVILDRPVIDKTGLAGRFNIHLELTAHALGIDRPLTLPEVSDPTTPATSANAPLIFSAIQNAVRKLGLNLEPAMGPGEFLVIDHIERPSGN